MKVITLDVKSKIFAQYFGSEYIYKNEFGSFKGTIEFGHNTKSHIENKNSRILLKKLINISDEDAIEIAKMQVYRYGEEKNFERTTMYEHHTVFMGEKAEDYVKSLLINSIYHDEFSLNIWQYLMSKGYALPYLDYSVEELVELGVYKLI